MAIIEIPDLTDDPERVRHHCLQHISFSIELNVNNYGDSWTSIEHIQNSPEFARRPLGPAVNGSRNQGVHAGILIQC